MPRVYASDEDDEEDDDDEVGEFCRIGFSMGLSSFFATMDFHSKKQQEIHARAPRGIARVSTLCRAAL
jgi:hypothetical protein